MEEEEGEKEKKEEEEEKKKKENHEMKLQPDRLFLNCPLIGGKIAQE